MVFATLLGGVLARIPVAVLAALLVAVGTKLVNPGAIREFVHHREASAYFITLFGVVAINLLAGIGLGVAWATLRLLRQRTRVRVDIQQRGERCHVVLRGALTFVGVPKVTAALTSVPLGRQVDVDLDVDIIDHAAFDALDTWRTSYERTGGHVGMDLRHESWHSVANGRSRTGNWPDDQHAETSGAPPS